MAVPGSGSFPPALCLAEQPHRNTSSGLGTAPSPHNRTHRSPSGVPCLQVQRATGIGNSRSILVTASDPNGFQLGVSQDVRGQINFLTKDTGEAQPLQQL